MLQDDATTCMVIDACDDDALYFTQFSLLRPFLQPVIPLNCALVVVLCLRILRNNISILGVIFALKNSSYRSIEICTCVILYWSNRDLIFR